MRASSLKIVLAFALCTPYAHSMQHVRNLFKDHTNIGRTLEERQEILNSKQKVSQLFAWSAVATLVGTLAHIIGTSIYERKAPLYVITKRHEIIGAAATLAIFGAAWIMGGLQDACPTKPVERSRGQENSTSQEHKATAEPQKKEAEIKQQEAKSYASFLKDTPPDLLPFLEKDEEGNFIEKPIEFGDEQDKKFIDKLKGIVHQQELIKLMWHTNAQYKIMTRLEALAQADFDGAQELYERMRKQS